MDFEIKKVPIDSLILDPANARKHGDKNLSAIKGSIAKFGQVEPLIVQRATRIVIGGNGRLVAMKSLGMDTVNIVEVDLDEIQAAGLAIALNRTAELAEWDAGTLGDLLKALKAEDFPLDEIGFDDDDFMSMAPEPTPEGLTDPDAVPENVETRCKPGDLWQLGNHRLLCGDSTNVQHVERLMGGEKADFIFTDPPYGVGFGYGAHDDRGGEQYADFIRASWHVMASMACPVVLTPGNVNLRLWLSLADFKLACWVKKNAMSPSGIAHLNVFEVLLLHGTSGRRSTDLFEYPVKMQEGVGDHPCPKLLALVEDAIGSWAPPTATLFEPFCGSGSTLIACEKTARRCYGMEIDPKYCDVILSRWEQFTGKQAALLDG